MTPSTRKAPAKKKPPARAQLATPSPLRSSPWALVLAIAALVAAAVVAFLLLTGDDDDSGDSPAATALNEPELIQRAALLPHPVYWLGPSASGVYELSSLDDGRVYVRYLTADDQAGDPNPDYISVGTYPLADPAADLRAIAADQGAKVEKGEGYSYVAPDANRVYAVFDSDPDLELEIFAPEAEAALKALRSGTLEPLG